MPFDQTATIAQHPTPEAFAAATEAYNAWAAHQVRQIERMNAAGDAHTRAQSDEAARMIRLINRFRYPNEPQLRAENLRIGVEALRAIKTAGAATMVQISIEALRKEGEAGEVAATCAWTLLRNAPADCWENMPIIDTVRMHFASNEVAQTGLDWAIAWGEWLIARRTGQADAA